MTSFRNTIFLLFAISILYSCYCGDNNSSLEIITATKDNDDITLESTLNLSEDNNASMFKVNGTNNGTISTLNATINVHNVTFETPVLIGDYNASKLTMEWALTSYSEIAKRLIELQYKDLPYGLTFFLNHFIMSKKYQFCETNNFRRPLNSVNAVIILFRF